jgi:hypothetical protein
MVYGKQLPVLIYDKEHVENNEKKENVTLFLYPSTHQLINVFKSTFGFSSIDDALVDAMLGYKKDSPQVLQSAPPDAPYGPWELPPSMKGIAIAGDEARKMNKRKRKRGKSLMPSRSQAFTDEALFEDGS